MTSYSNSSVKGTSNADFTIAPPPPPEISVTVPNGSEVLEAGTTETIRWTYKGNIGSYVKIELLKNGSLNRTISYAVSKGNNGNGSYNWTISSTQIPGLDYRIRITSISKTAVKDTSEADFTIS